MPKVIDETTGNVITTKPYTDEGEVDAKNIADTNPNWVVESDENTFSPGGMYNAPDRTETIMGYGKGGKIPKYDSGGKIKVKI